MSDIILLVLLMGIGSSLVLTPMFRNMAKARGLVDEPDGIRKVHSVAVPRIGGLPVYLAFVVAFITLQSVAPPPALIGQGDLLHLVMAGGIVMLLGLADDLVGARPAVKLFVQTLAALYVYHNGFTISVISNPFGADSITLGWLSLPLTVLWFVGMSNAFNLIDGLDGLAAGIGLFSVTTLFMAALVNDHWDVALVATALGGALLGFLRYNSNPASIFLGDSGALFVGFTLAGIAVRGSMKSSAAIAVAAPLLALAVPLLDASVAVLRRTVRGQSPFAADHDHIHHRMLRRGLTPQRVVLTLYAAAALFGALSLLTMTRRGQTVGLLVLASSVVCWIGIQQLGYSEFAEMQRVLRQTLFEGRRSVSNNLYLSELQTRLSVASDVEALWRALGEAAGHLGFETVELCWGAGTERRHWAWRADHVDMAGARLRFSFPLDEDEPDSRLDLECAVTAHHFETERLTSVVAEGFAPRFRTLMRAGAGQQERVLEDATV